MDRLTKRDKGGNARMDCDKCDIRYREGCCSQRLCKNSLIDRLAAYEDTGLTPEEIKEDMPDVRKIEEKLAAYEDAEANGLLVRLPCKIGDKVYRIEYIWDDSNPGGYVVGVAEKMFHLLLLGEFGKTVFRTREEAEVALADDKE